MTDLKGRDLDRAIAELMGATVTDRAPIWDAAPTDMWRKDERGWSHLPHFTKSLDDLYHGPERLLREAGWRMLADVYDDTFLEFEERWGEPMPEGTYRDAPRPIQERIERAVEARVRAEVEGEREALRLANDAADEAIAAFSRVEFTLTSLKGWLRHNGHTEQIEWIERALTEGAALRATPTDGGEA